MFSSDYIAFEAQDAPLPEEVTRHQEDGQSSKKRSLPKSPCNSLKRKLQEFSKDAKPLGQKESKKQKSQMVPKSTECRICDLKFQTDLELEEHLFSILHHRALDTRERSKNHKCILCGKGCGSLNAFIEHLRSETHKSNYSRRQSEIAAGTYRKSSDVERRTSTSVHGQEETFSWNSEAYRNGTEEEYPGPDSDWHRQNHSVNWNRRQRTDNSGLLPTPHQPPRYMGFGHRNQTQRDYFNQGYPKYAPWTAQQQRQQWQGWGGQPNYYHQTRWSVGDRYTYDRGREWWNDQLPSDRKFEEEQCNDNNSGQQSKLAHAPKGDNKRMTNLLAQARETIHSSPLVNIQRTNAKAPHAQVVKADNRVSSTTDQLQNSKTSRSINTATATANPVRTSSRKKKWKGRKKKGAKNTKPNSFEIHSLQAWCNIVNPHQKTSVLSQAKTTTQSAKATHDLKSTSGGKKRMQQLLAQAHRATHGSKTKLCNESDANCSASSTLPRKTYSSPNLTSCKVKVPDDNCKNMSWTSSAASLPSLSSLFAPNNKKLATNTKNKSAILGKKGDFASGSKTINRIGPNKSGTTVKAPKVLTHANQPATVTTVTTVQERPIALEKSLTPDMFKEFQKQIDIALALHPSTATSSEVRSWKKMEPLTQPAFTSAHLRSSWSQGMKKTHGNEPNSQGLLGSTPTTSKQPDTTDNIRRKFWKILDEITCDDNVQENKKNAEDKTGRQIPLSANDVSHESGKKDVSAEEKPHEIVFTSVSLDEVLLCDTPAASESTLNLTDTVYLPAAPGIPVDASNTAASDLSSPRCIQRTCTSDIETPTSKKRTNPPPNINRARSRLSSKHKDGLSPDVSSDVKQAKLRKLLMKYDRTRRNSSTSPDSLTPRIDLKKAAGPRFGIDLNSVNRPVEVVDDVSSLATSVELEVTNSTARSLSESGGATSFTTAATGSLSSFQETMSTEQQNCSPVSAPPLPQREKAPENAKVNGHSLNSRLLIMSEKEEEIHAAIRSLDIEDSNMQVEVDRMVGVINELQIQLTKLQERKSTIQALKIGNANELSKLRLERLSLLRGSVSVNPENVFQDVTPNCRRFVRMPYTHSTPTPQNGGNFESMTQSVSGSFNQRPFSAPFSNIASPEVTSTVSEHAPAVARNPVGVSSLPNVTLKTEPGLFLNNNAFPQTSDPSLPKPGSAHEEGVKEPATSFSDNRSEQTNGTSTLISDTVGIKQERIEKAASDRSLPNVRGISHSTALQTGSSNVNDPLFRTTCENSHSNSSAEFYSFANASGSASVQNSAVVDRILAKYASSHPKEQAEIASVKLKNHCNQAPKRTASIHTKASPTRRSPRPGSRRPTPQFHHNIESGEHVLTEVTYNSVTETDSAMSSNDLKTHDAALVGMHLANAGLLTCSLDESLALHKLDTGQKSVLNLKATPTAMTVFFNGLDVVSVALQKIVSFASPSNPYVVVKKMEHILRIYTIELLNNTPGKASFRQVEEVQTKTRVLCMCVDNKTLYCGMRDGMVAIIPLSDSNKIIDEVEVLECHSHSAVTCLTTGTEGVRRILCCGSTDCTVSVRDANDGLLLRTIQGHSKTVTCVQLVHHELFSAGVDRQVLGHDLNSGHLLHRFIGHAGVVRSLHVAGSCMITLCSDRNIRFYNTDNCRLMRKPKPAPSLPLFACVTSSENSHVAYVGCQDGTVLQKLTFPTMEEQPILIDSPPNNTPNAKGTPKQPSAETPENDAINLVGDYECLWAGCQHHGTFATEEELRMHVLNAHTNFYNLTEYALDRASMTLSVGTCCQWDQCTHYFAPELDTVIDVHTHVQRHFQKQI